MYEKFHTARALLTKVNSTTKEKNKSFSWLVVVVDFRRIQKIVFQRNFPLMIMCALMLM
jgi:hypothetical protein